jgi:hypothetical protein
VRNDLKIIFIISIFLFTATTSIKKSNASTAIGDITAEVVDQSVSVGGDSDGNGIYDNVSREELDAATAERGEKYFYRGNVIYDLTSEPNSLVTVHYQSGDNNTSLKKDGDSIEKITKINFDYNSELMSFDDEGNSRLKINPSFFIENNPFKSDYKVVYYVTLLY